MNWKSLQDTGPTLALSGIEQDSSLVVTSSTKFTKVTKSGVTAAIEIISLAAFAVPCFTTDVRQVERRRQRWLPHSPGTRHGH